eukprot:6469270-Amphidinium_carterae.1
MVGSLALLLRPCDANKNGRWEGLVIDSCVSKPLAVVSTFRIALGLGGWEMPAHASCIRPRPLG